MNKGILFFPDNHSPSGIMVSILPAGLMIEGWYDGNFALMAEPVLILWEQLDKVRKESKEYIDGIGE